VEGFLQGCDNDTSQMCFEAIERAAAAGRESGFIRCGGLSLRPSCKRKVSHANQRVDYAKPGNAHCGHLATNTPKHETNTTLDFVSSWLRLQKIDRATR